MAADLNPADIVSVAQSDGPSCTARLGAAQARGLVKVVARTLDWPRGGGANGVRCQRRKWRGNGDRPRLQAPKECA